MRANKKEALRPFFIGGQGASLIPVHPSKL